MLTLAEKPPKNVSDVSSGRKTGAGCISTSSKDATSIIKSKLSLSGVISITLAETPQKCKGWSCRPDKQMGQTLQNKNRLKVPKTVAGCVFSRGAIKT